MASIEDVRFDGRYWDNLNDCPLVRTVKPEVQNMKIKVTVVYAMDDKDAQHLIEGVKTRQVMGGTGAIVACYQGDAMEERDAAQGELAALREELADMQHWRDLALQFDNHRMTALWHLKTLAANPSYAPAVSEFLAAPPLPASEIVQRLIAAEHRNATITTLLREGLEEYKNGDDWIDRVIAALRNQPTESGAGE